MYAMPELKIPFAWHILFTKVFSFNVGKQQISCIFHYITFFNVFICSYLHIIDRYLAQWPEKKRAHCAEIVRFSIQMSVEQKLKSCFVLLIIDWFHYLIICHTETITSTYTYYKHLLVHSSFMYFMLDCH